MLLQENSFHYSLIDNLFLLLNPVVDPIIYVLRIKKYRQHILCKRLKSISVSDATNSTVLS